MPHAVGVDVAGLVPEHDLRRGALPALLTGLGVARDSGDEGEHEENANHPGFDAHPRQWIYFGGILRAMTSDDDWFGRWRDGRIGFHEGRPNTMLERHAGELGTGRRVLVPLCGKAEDLAWLAARGHTVVGVELVEDAVRAFFAEHDLTPQVAPRGPLVAYTAGAITLLVGDIFATTPELLGPIDAFYDRAALIALPSQLRPRYIAHLRGLLPVDSRGLVVTLEYPEHQMTGPPFAVREPEVRALFAGCDLQLLDSGQARGGACQERGVTGTVKCFAIRVR